MHSIIDRTFDPSQSAYSVLRLIAVAFVLGIAASFMIFSLGNIVLPGPGSSDGRVGPTVRTDSGAAKVEPARNTDEPTGSGKPIYAFEGVTVEDVVDDFRTAIAASLLKNYKDVEAISLLEQVRSPRIKNSSTYLAVYSEALIETGRSESALPLTQKLVALSDESNGYMGYLTRARAFYGVAKYKESLEDFEKSLERFQKMMSARGQERQRANSPLRITESRILRGKGACLERLGKNKEAVREYELAVLASSGYGPYVTAPVIVSPDEKARLQEGVGLLEQSVSRYKTSSSAHARLADVYVRLGEDKSAINEYSEAIRLIGSSDPFRLLYKRAGAYYAAGLFREACADLRLVFVEDPLTTPGKAGSSDRQRSPLGRVFIFPEPLVRQLVRRLDGEILENPNRADNYFKRAILNFSMKHYPSARSDLGKYFQMTSSLQAASENRARAIVYLVLCDLKEGKAGQAQQMVEDREAVLSGSKFWEGVATYLTSDGQDKDFQKLLGIAGSEKTRQIQAYYFAAQKLDLSAGLKETLTASKKAVDLGPLEIDEYVLSSLDLLPRIVYLSGSSRNATHPDHR